MNKVFLSELACAPLREYIEDTGTEVVYVASDDPPVGESIATHADIYMCQLGLWDGAVIFRGDRERLGRKYPEDVIYNAVCTGKYFIHNLKYTSAALTDAAKELFPNIEYVDVPQGYTRCCCLPVDERSFITSDRGIASVLEKHDADVLTVEPGHISLPGFEYGFIGGCAGGIVKDGRKTIVFNGDLDLHPDADAIKDFIGSRGMDVVSFSGHVLEDIGSILIAGRPCL